MQSFLIQTNFVGVTLNFSLQSHIEAVNCRFSNCVHITPLYLNCFKFAKIYRCLLENCAADVFSGFYFDNVKEISILETTIRNTSSYYSYGDEGGIPLAAYGNIAKISTLNISHTTTRHISSLETKNNSYSDIRYINSVDCSSYRVVYQFNSNVDDCYLRSSNTINCSSTDDVFGIVRAVLQDNCTLYVKNCVFNQCECKCMFYGESPIIVENCFSSDYRFNHSVSFNETFAFREPLHISVPDYNDIVQLCRTNSRRCLKHILKYTLLESIFY